MLERGQSVTHLYFDMMFFNNTVIIVRLKPLQSYRNFGSIKVRFPPGMHTKTKKIMKTRYVTKGANL
jgi:hypothetical protein